MKEHSSESGIIELNTDDPFNLVRIPILELKVLELFELRLKRRFDYQDEDQYKIMEALILSNVKKSIKGKIEHSFYYYREEAAKFLYNKFDIELKEFKGNVSAIKKHIHELYHLSKFAVIKNYAFDKELIKAFKTVLEYYIGKQDLWLTQNDRY
ncbi:MAG: hypothetical protein LN589_04300 [Rickettsia endosymbiont of Eriopis connexa]|nr:hypothetical protein [Rickettsia endosymbiont of Eriopis connexa]